MLARGHGDQAFLGSSLPLVMLRFDKFISKGLVALQIPPRGILASGHSSKLRKDAGQTEMSELERRRYRRGREGWERAGQCYGDLHSMFAPGAFCSVSQDLPSAPTK